MNPTDLQNYELAERKHVRTTGSGIWAAMFFVILGAVLAYGVGTAQFVTAPQGAVAVFALGIMGWMLHDAVKDTRTEYVLVKKDDSK